MYAQTPVIADPSVQVSPFGPADVKHLGRRFGALMVDEILITAVTVGLILLMIHPSQTPFTAYGHQWVLVRYTAQQQMLRLGVIFLMRFGYFTMLEWALGATVGKFVFALRVVDFSGGSISFIQALRRNVLRILGGPFTYLIGWIVAMRNDRRQRGGDRAAGTLVVAASSLERARSIWIAPPDYQSVLSTRSVSAPN